MREGDRPTTPSIVANTSPSEQLVDWPDALIVYVSPENHVVGPSPAGTYTAPLLVYRASSL